MILVLLLCVIAGIPAALAEKPAEQGHAVETIGQGTVNWTTGVVTAVGSGAPPPNAVNPTQARAMAERAAFSVALRNLLEAVKGVQVDSTTVIENFLVKSDAIKTKITGYVKGARIIKTDRQPDGTVDVTIAVAMKGELVDALLPKEFGAAPAAIPAPVPPAATPAPAPVEAYTGLLIDARGLGLKPALVPRLLDEQGKEVYAGAVLTRDQAVEAGVAGYARDLVAASRQPRVTDNPLVVKAVKASGSKPTDIILAPDSVKAIQHAETASQFLKQARVVVVYD